MFFYHLLWTMALPVCLPAALLSGDERFCSRLRLRPPSGVRGDRPVWIHALSVGEVLSALPLVQSLRSGCVSRPVVFTVSTAKGMSTAREVLSGHVDDLLYMPLDAWWAVGRIVKHINPRVFVLVESDIWPGLLDCIGRAGIKRLLVNGRVSPRTFRSYRRFPFAARRLFRGLDLCLMQSELDRERVLAIGADPGKVKVGGNIKFDRIVTPMSPEERMSWFELFALAPEDPVIVAGSTHPGEEEMLLDAFSLLRSKAPEARLIIAPRNIDRAAEIETMAGRRNFVSIRRSSAPSVRRPDVIVLDTIGELGRIYGLCTAGFIGGSLVPAGGHNPIEPAGFGRPVLFGPHMHNFDAMARMLDDAGGCVRVESQNELGEALIRLVTDPSLGKRMGLRGLDFVNFNRGAVAGAVEKIESMAVNPKSEVYGF